EVFPAENGRCTADLTLDQGTHPGGFNWAEARASCLMCYQDGGRKLCSRHPLNPHATNTAQGFLSCWDVLYQTFSDRQTPDRWVLQTPDTRGTILGTINPPETNGFAVIPV